MEKVAFTLIGIAAAAWLITVFVGLIAAWPYGIFGLAGFAGLGLLLFKVTTERLTNEEDDYYAKNVHQ